METLRFLQYSFYRAVNALMAGQVDAVNTLQCLERVAEREGLMAAERAWRKKNPYTLL